LNPGAQLGQSTVTLRGLSRSFHCPLFFLEVSIGSEKEYVFSICSVLHKDVKIIVPFGRLPWSFKEIVSILILSDAN